jgi:hypothetical protein
MSGHVCHVLKDSLATDCDADTEVVTTGSFGIQKTYIYNVGNGTWREGPDLTSIRYQAVSIGLGDSMVVAGGNSLIGGPDDTATR